MAKGKRRTLFFVCLGLGCYVAGIATAALSLAVTTRVNVSNGAVRQKISICGVTIRDQRPPSNELFMSLPLPKGVMREARDEWLTGSTFLFTSQYSPQRTGAWVLQDMQEVAYSAFDLGIEAASEYKAEYLEVMRTEGPGAAAEQVIEGKIRPALQKLGSQ